MGEREKARVMDEKAMARAIARIGYEVVERNRGARDLCIVGIRTRGAFLAERIAARIVHEEGGQIPTGSLDITPYRDDRIGAVPGNDTSELHFSVTGKRVVLVDDVLYTGRTVRAAIDAVMARGRPRCIQLAALIDRGHRELPIRADFIGKNLPTSSEETVRVMLRECDALDCVAIFESTGKEEKYVI